MAGEEGTMGKRVVILGVVIAVMALVVGASGRKWTGGLSRRSTPTQPQVELTFQLED
jgi:hypothetical protein